ncbi:MAG: indolepyruvate oxidoreductase subunit beta [Rectinema sp.]
MDEKSEEGMTYDMLLCGVGGQGSLSVAVLIARAAMASGLSVKQSEVHGMAQRGGEVLAHLRISDSTIESPTIPLGCADLILAFEPLEALRYLPWLSRESGAIVAASSPVKNIPDYPELESVLAELGSLPRTRIVDAEGIARAAGNPRSANVVLVGAASRLIPVPAESIEREIAEFFARKGEEMVRINVKAFQDGRNS